MDNVILVFLAASILLSGMVLGIVIPLVRDLNLYSRKVRDQAEEFEKITKLASEANISLANKILQLEEKVSSFEFWKINSSKGKM